MGPSAADNGGMTTPRQDAPFVGYGPGPEGPGPALDGPGAAQENPWSAPGRDGYGPPQPTASVLREPVVLMPAPVRGWAAASTARRAFAGVWVLLAAWWLAGTLGLLLGFFPFGVLLLWETAVWALVGLTAVLGPPACYSAARIVRPYPNGPRGERPYRHWCAAVGSAYGFPLVLGLMSDGLLRSADVQGAAVAAVVVAALAGPVTLLWGLIAATGRGVGSARDTAPARG